MGIDGIGKPSGPALPSAPLAGSQRVGETFALREGVTTGPLAATDAVGTVEPGTLERLRSGAIDVAQYIELKVAEATAHLASLPPADLERIQEALRDRLASDPALVALREVVAQAAAPADSRR